jgi:integrase
MPPSGSVIAYHGKRGTVYRIVFRPHANAPQVKETIGTDAKEAARALRRRLAECDQGTYAAPTRTTFNEFADRFLRDYAEPRVRPKTLTDYKATLKNHLRPEFGHLALEDVTPLTIDRYIARKQREKKPLSPKTLNNHLRLLHVMMGRAVKWRLLRVNSADAIDKLREPEDVTEPLTPAEARAIIDAASPIVRLFGLTAVLTGARRNEVLSLTWDRCDLDKAVLTLDRQWSPTGWAPLKSRKRIHAMPAELWQALAAHRATSPYIASDDFVFATATGKPIDGGNMLKWWKDAATKAKVTRRVWLHQLRHTAGTRAAEMGLSALEVAAILGHAQASTSERYIHLARGIDRERAERLAAKTISTGQEV